MFSPVACPKLEEDVPWKAIPGQGWDGHMSDGTWAIGADQGGCKTFLLAPTGLPDCKTILPYG